MSEKFLFQQWPVYRAAVEFAKEAHRFCLECAAIADLGLEIGLLEKTVHEQMQARLENLGKMLSGMIRYFEKGENHFTG